MKTFTLKLGRTELEAFNSCLRSPNVWITHNDFQRMIRGTVHELATKLQKKEFNKGSNFSITLPDYQAIALKHYLEQHLIPLYRYNNTLYEYNLLARIFLQLDQAYTSQLKDRQLAQNII